jgi:hypothetical protein
MANHFGIRFGRKVMSLFLEKGAKLRVIFYDPIVNQHDVVGSMGMRIVFRGSAVSGPSRVANAGASDQEVSVVQHLLKIPDLSLGAFDLDLVTSGNRNTR